MNAKKLLTALALAIATTMVLYAVPACPEPNTIVNADGSLLTLVLHGDEFYSFTTTTDNFTVVRDNNGNWVYAKLLNGRLAPTSTVAHDPGQRTQAELQLLANTQPRLLDDRTTIQARKAHVINDHPVIHHAPIHKANTTKGSGFRGLVVLINFNDCSFRDGINDVDDIRQFYDDMMNQKGYTGYTSSNNLFNSYGSYTGSVRDYFYDNSFGQFDPQFDVIGPIDMDYSMTSGREQGNYMFVEAFNNIFFYQYDLYNLNWNDYDNDGDGVLDLVYFIVAGFGSNFSGNDASYLWPHATYFVNSNGEPVVRVACSTEYYGLNQENRFIPDGIGCICHEFSHCLGVMDLYDTDYESSGGQSHVPGKWDIMSGGSYLNFSRTPAGYSLYERYAMGFTNPTVLRFGGKYTLQPIGDYNKGFIIESPNAEEKFLLENRQLSSKWDAYIPGHGMLVARMDSTDHVVWILNDINCDPAHNYYELLRAGGTTEGDLDSDPFPGTAGVSAIAAAGPSTPNLLTWDQQANALAISDIAEDIYGNISFHINPTETQLYPVTICGHQLSSDTDYDNLADTLRNENRLTGNGTINYDPVTNTLTLDNVTLQQEHTVSETKKVNIGYDPAYSNVEGFADTLHIVVLDSVNIYSTSTGGHGLKLKDIYAKIEGSGTLSIDIPGSVGLGIVLDNANAEICTRGNLTINAAYGVYAYSGGGQFIVNDYDFGHSPTVTIYARSSTMKRLTELVLGEGYAITDPVGATLTDGELLDNDGNIIKGRNVVIEQTRLPIALFKQPLYSTWTLDKWQETCQALQNYGLLNEGGTIAYDHSTHTLTLNNARIDCNVSIDNSDNVLSNGYYSSEHDCNVDGYSDFKIAVNGNCAISSTTAVPFYSNHGTTTITGSGTLRLEANSTDPAVSLKSFSTLIADGPDLTLTSNGTTGILGSITGKLRFDSGTTTITTPNGSPWMLIQSAILGNDISILQPEGAYIERSSTSPRISYYTVFNADGTPFSKGTLIIGPTNIYGDVDGNRIVDISDLNALINIILNKAVPSDFSGVADVDASGEIDVSDINIVINIILN